MSDAHEKYNGLFHCYELISPNEYSEKTIGLHAFLTRPSVGDINFSDIIDEVEKHGQAGEAAGYIASLKRKRDNLHDIEASIEKCLMINRLIKYIEENEEYFMSIITHIRLEMKVRMTDNQVNQTIQYPNDFRQRELDFSKRKFAQNVRRLFYLSHKEGKEPQNIIHLKNRTTEHLSYILDCKMRYEPKFRQTGLGEFSRILNNSFMIMTHPHSGVNPVTVYERKGPGEYTAKISVIIVSLLHDFIETHPNMIKVDDIEPSLWPLSPLYKLIEPRTISWKTCQLERYPGDKPQIIHYAELSFITIQQTSVKDTRVHFAQLLHSLKFAIKLHINLTEYHISTTRQIILESLPFGIAPRNCYIPYMLTRVILDDIRRFSKCTLPDVRIIQNYIRRYFIHRTGVEPKEYVSTYLLEELQNAIRERKNSQTLEDLYIYFLTPFVSQVEFMAKHPVLAMFYADGLFLGICTSERVKEYTDKFCNNQLSIVAIRLESITRTDYKANASENKPSHAIKDLKCAVRVDIYNHRTNTTKYRTLDPASSAALISDIKRFVFTAHSRNADTIRILSNLNDGANGTNYKTYRDFTKYDDKRLREMSKTDGTYQLLNNLMDVVENDDDEDIRNTALDATIHHEETFNTCSNHVYEGMSDDSQALSNNQRKVQEILSQPELVQEILHQLTQLNVISFVQQQQTYSLMNVYEQNNTNQLQYENIHTVEDNTSEQAIDFDFLMTDEMLSLYNNPEFESRFDGLVTEICPSQNGVNEFDHSIEF